MNEGEALFEMAFHTSEHDTATRKAEVVPDSTGKRGGAVRMEMTRLQVFKLELSAAI